MELNDLVYKKIVKLSEQGDELADNFKYDKAILKYEQALNLLPKLSIIGRQLLGFLLHLETFII